jgi:peptide/nickel transport system substrate-binding protein
MGGTDEQPGVLAIKELTRREMIAAAVAGGVALSLPARALSSVAASPKRGGNLRVGVVGGGASETLDFNKSLSEIDVTRTRALFEGLSDYTPNGKPYPVLVEEFSPNKNASVWKLKLRQGVLFHNGKEMTADDVVYTLQYMINPKNKTQGAAALSGFLVASGIHKTDKYGLTLVLQKPNAFLETNFADRAIKVMPDGTTAHQLATNPVGTGPFKMGTFKAGERSNFPANKNYRIHGGPYVDNLEVISINDATARLNALKAGQIDALSQLDPKLISQVTTDKKLTLLDKPAGTFTAQYMQITTPPFNDVRVRQAMRLLVDRPQIIQNALGGHGKVGNDLSSWFDPAYDSSLPQRHYDPERAKSLLHAAGQDNLSVDLYTSSVAPAMLESSTLMAQQAQAAGVTINLKNTPADKYWSGPYLKQAFACTNWGGRPLAAFAVLAYTSDAPYNETVWKKPAWDKLLKQAFSTADEAKRTELLHAAQKPLYDSGGYIIWGFVNTTDAVSARLKGIVPSVIRPLGYYDFHNAFFV